MPSVEAGTLPLYSLPFWNPIAGKCLCMSSTCVFTDDSRPIGTVLALNLFPAEQREPDGHAHGQGGRRQSYVPFKGRGAWCPQRVWAATLVGALGALAGIVGCLQVRRVRLWPDY
ncbi:hypothetical protein B0H17DRAFT_1197889 [Mycena rosella]|uniref:Uncharacterized protein n=1 Tax=Mycena rosella TaxID=1033263 RepID=A0AAD7GLN6_MYCRO|nr:hypothetical protein B0H17DRAFT_1197889 [Mycena rosella]